MKTMPTLIKLASAEVDEKRLALRVEQGREDAAKAALAELEAGLAAEQERAKSLSDAAYAYGAFGAAAVKRRETLQQELASAGAAVAAAREALRVSFERQKRYEITQEGRRRQDEAAVRRRDTIEADERALQGHRRRRG